MSDKPETSADIEAELRELSESAKYAKYSEYQPTVYGKPIALYFAELADRIKAVVKQELCNGAAMREALSDACYAMFNFLKTQSGGFEEMAIALDKAKAALAAAPPRNCDRFGGDIDKLREACARERGLNPEEDFPDVFPDWLLAPSTEKEGGEK